MQIKKVMTKLNLSIAERLHFTELLPRAAGIIEMEIIRGLKERVRFTPKEIDEFELRDLRNGSVVWDGSKAKLREFRFEDSEIKLIKKGVQILDKEERVTDEILDLAKKILSIKTKED